MAPTRRSQGNCTIKGSTASGEPSPSGAIEPVVTKSKPNTKKKRAANTATIAASHVDPSGPHSDTVNPPDAGVKGRKRKFPATTATSAQPNNSDGDEPTVTNDPPKAKRKRVKSSPRSPLPDRAKRLVNPGKPDKPREKRSSAEVQAEKDNKARIARELKELEEQKILLLARMELQEEEEEANDRRNIVRHLGDSRDDDIQSEVFSFTAIDNEESEDSGSENVDGKKGTKPGPNASKKAPKKKAGEYRHAIDTAKETLKAQVAAPSRKRKGPAANETRSTKKAKETSTTGLVANWRNRVGDPAKKAKDQENHEDAVGGLADSDAEAIPPPKNAERQQMGKTTRVNDMVKIVDSEEEVEDVVTPIPTRAKAIVPRSPVKALKAPKLRKAKAEATTADSKNIKVEAKEGNLYSNTDIPQFMRSGWSSSFLPTLYDSLSNSEKPFDHFCKGPEIIAKIQAAIEAVWPGTDYRVTWSNDSCLKAVDRLNEKRSWFGSQALDIVDKFFQSPQFTNNPTAVKEYAEWAIRGDGPAIYATPTPIECVVDREDPSYIKPNGIYESEFVKKIMNLFLKSTKGSRTTPGQPKGALALTAAGLDRAFTAYSTGVRPTKVDSFSRDNVSDIVDDYMETIVGFSENRWNRIFSTWGQKVPQAAAKPTTDRSAARRKLYVGSSPEKA